MKLLKTVSTLCFSSALSLLVAACGISIGGGSGGAGGGSDTSASSGAGVECRGPNPAGCRSQGCPDGQKCVVDVDAGCTPSDCGCDPETGTWYCTDDCGGGICVPDEPTGCREPNPAGCKSQGCPDGHKCVDEGCAPSICRCDPTTGGWACTRDCGGGICVPDEPTGCREPNPAGCRSQGCPDGQKCVVDLDAGCAPSSCRCDPTTGGWACTRDCGGGVCVPDEPTACAGPNPAGCRSQGCPDGQKCVDEGCTPSACGCDTETGRWFCTADCNGGTCVPDEPTACRGPNPVGCRVQGCPDGQRCVNEGCAPSACGCDAATGSWICTADCGGGTCVPAR